MCQNVFIWEVCVVWRTILFNIYLKQKQTLLICKLRMWDSECKVPPTITTCAKSLIFCKSVSEWELQKKNFIKCIELPGYSEFLIGRSGDNCFALLPPCESYWKDSWAASKFYLRFVNEVLKSWWITQELGLKCVCVIRLDIAWAQGNLLLSSEKLNKMKSCAGLISLVNIVPDLSVVDLWGGLKKKWIVM